MFNRYIIVPFVAWAVAQFLKFILAAFRGDVNFRYLYGSGGMPSVHSAVVTALATTALLVDGVRSPIFGITIILAAIVMYDSFGVRRSAGEQAVAINQILASMDIDHLRHPNVHLREIMGHTPPQVIAGAILGFILACLFNADKLTAVGAIITLNVGFGMAILVAAAAVLLLLAAIASRLILMRKYRAVAIGRQLAKRLFWTLGLLAIIGLLLALIEYEQIAIAVWLIWPVIYVLALITAGILLWLPYRGGKIAAAAAEHAAATEKSKWMEGPNKKHRAKSKRRK